jgi:hypothetical protein
MKKLVKEAKGLNPSFNAADIRGKCKYTTLKDATQDWLITDQPPH